MGEINCKQTRRIASKILKNLNPVYKKEFDKAYWLKDMEQSINSVKRYADEGSKKNISCLPSEFSLVNMSLTCIGFLSLSVYNKEEDEQLFPRKWLRNNDCPNANLVLQCMLTQLTNFTLSTVLLLEKGMDNQARVLNRQIMELTEQILVCMHSKETFKEYVKGHDETSSENAWRTLFSRGRLSKKLREMENSLGFDEEFSLDLSTKRKENYKFYSQSVHHSFISTTVGSHFTSWEDKEGIHHGIFGGENKDIKGTLQGLNYTLWYFLLCFFAVLDKQYGISPKDLKGGLWTETFALYFCVKDVYLKKKN